LALNFESNGYSVAGYDLNLRFDKSLFKDKNIKLFDSLEELIHVLDKPRCILMMVPAGKPVDKGIISTKPHLEKDAAINDGGNSLFVLFLINLEIWVIPCD
jgi:6-phosphogluconate dehydrogenase